MIVIWISKTVDWRQDRPYISGFIVILLCTYVLWAGPVVKAPVGAQYQYDDAVKTYLNIRDHFDAGDWTIVSPVEEYSMVEAYGYHTNLWEFVQRNATDSEDPMGFPTAHVFFFVETVPLNLGGPLQHDEALKPFPGPAEGDISTFYYYTPNRRILEAKMYSWAEWYLKTYPDRMTIYYESPTMKVYHLVQQAKEPPDKLPLLPENMEGVW
jgi:hypothetical protein